MQVTPEMIAAAQEATPRWMNATDSELRYILEAALDAMPKATGGHVREPIVVDRCFPELQQFKLNPPITVPAGATITFLLASGPGVNVDGVASMTRMDVTSEAEKPEGVAAHWLIGKAADDEPEQEADDLHRLAPPPTIPDEMLSTDGYEDHAAALVADMERRAAQQWIPVTEPRPLATINQLRYHLGESLDFVLGATLRSSGYDPPFPEAVRQGKNGEPLYDPDAVKAWYDALPQAADG